jgi:hypothetical protein
MSGCRVLKLDANVEVLAKAGALLLYPPGAEAPRYCEFEVTQK